MRFPLLGLARDLHPLANAHAERTIEKLPAKTAGSFTLFFNDIPEGGTTP